MDNLSPTGSISADNPESEPKIQVVENSVASLPVEVKLSEEAQEYESGND